MPTVLAKSYLGYRQGIASLRVQNLRFTFGFEHSTRNDRLGRG